MKFSYHNHTNYSDGTNTPEEMIKKAIECGFTDFAITDHIHNQIYSSWTLHFKDYKKYINHIKKVNENNPFINVLCGIEADYYKNKGTYWGRYEELLPYLDITVASLHEVCPNGEDFLIDGDGDSFNQLLYKEYNNDIKRLVTDYYITYIEMVENFDVQLYGHIDIVQKNNINNMYFHEGESYIVSLQEQLAKTLAKHDKVTEVNGGGVYRYGICPYYPSKQFGKILLDNGVKITIGLDAHNVDMVDGYYNSSIDYLKDIGYKEIAYYKNKKWEMISIEEIKS